MEKLGLLVRLNAKSGKEAEVAAFLKSALPLANAEMGTIRWYAIRIDAATFGIFDTFPGDQDRDAHLGGPIAAALMAKASDLLSRPPVIEKIEILASK